MLTHRKLLGIAAGYEEAEELVLDLNSCVPKVHKDQRLLVLFCLDDQVHQLVQRATPELGSRLGGDVKHHFCEFLLILSEVDLITR